MDEEIRAEIVAFAKIMETRLRENSNRGDWRAYNFYYLVACLAANLGHLVRGFQAEKSDAVQKSAADTANYAMMIADLYGSLAVRKR